MSDIKTYEGQLMVQGARFCIVASRFNGFIVDHLVAGALDALLRHGAKKEDIHLVKTPGAYELPLALQKAAASSATTPSWPSARSFAERRRISIMSRANASKVSASRSNEIPIAFGVLTVDTIEQAIERAGTKAGNKGAEAALSAIEMVNLLNQMAWHE